MPTCIGADVRPHSAFLEPHYPLLLVRISVGAVVALVRMRSWALGTLAPLAPFIEHPTLSWFGFLRTDLPLKLGDLCLEFRKLFRRIFV